jgi:hypothetical protein
LRGDAASRGIENLGSWSPKDFGEDFGQRELCFCQSDWGVTMKTNFVFRLTVAAILLGFAIWATLGSPHSTMRDWSPPSDKLWSSRESANQQSSLSILGGLRFFQH